MNILISNRYNGVMGDGIEPLPGKLFNKDIRGRARLDALFNSIGDMGQKFRKWFLSLLNKFVEIAYSVLGCTESEGLEG